MGVGLDRIDLVVDEAHNLPDHLRDLATVSLPEIGPTGARGAHRARRLRRPRGARARAGSSRSSRAPSTEPASTPMRPRRTVSSPRTPSRTPSSPRSVGPPTVSTRGSDALVSWGESLREERRRQRHLPRSWVHTVALTLLSWPQLNAPRDVKVVTRSPRRALEAYCPRRARSPPEPVRSATSPCTSPGPWRRSKTTGTPWGSASDARGS